MIKFRITAILSLSLYLTSCASVPETVVFTLADYDKVHSQTFPKIYVAPPKAKGAFQTNYVMTQTGLRLAQTGHMHWIDALPKLVQHQIQHSFNLQSVPKHSQRQKLDIDILFFGIKNQSDKIFTSDIKLFLKLSDHKGQLIKKKLFHQTLPIPAKKTYIIMETMNKNFHGIQGQILKWIP